MQDYWTDFRSRKLNRRQVLVSGGVALGVAAAACGKTQPKSASGGSGATAQGTPKLGGTLQINPVYGNPPHLDLHATTSVFSQTVVNFAAGRLMNVQSAPMDFSVWSTAAGTPNLALSAESPDAITWTLKLRNDVKWHNIPPVSGRQFVAEDVKANWTRAVSIKGGVWSAALDMMDPSQITTPDDQTVVFKLKYPFAPFPALLSATTLGAQYPREALAGTYDPKQVVIGTGGFVFDHFTPDVEFVAKKNPDFYMKGQPYVDTLRAAIIPDQSQRLAQFIGGHLDLAQFLPTDVDAVKRSVPNAQWMVETPGSGEMLWMQLGDQSSRYQDIRIRRALSMAIDRDAIGRAAYANDYILGFCPGPSLGPKQSLQYNQLPSETAPYFKYNPSEAKKLLEAAGAADMQVTIAYPQPYTLAGFIPAAEIVNNFLNQVGLKSSLQQVDYTNVYLNNGKGYSAGYTPKEVLVFSGIRGGSTQDPDGRLYDYFHSKSLVGAEHLSDPTLDTMIDKERTIVSQEERWKACLDIQRYVADKMYMVAFLPQPYNHWALQARAKNYYPYDGGVAPVKVWLDNA
jgi:peptide/nickel transport system substrate-binding protein